jgi:DNA polymerase kappa
MTEKEEFASQIIEEEEDLFFDQDSEEEEEEELIDANVKERNEDSFKKRLAGPSTNKVCSC